jgi:hypothetical protein
LFGVATGLLVLHTVRHTGGLEAVGGRVDFFIAEDLNAQMVESFVGVGILEEDEFEGRLGDGKIGVARHALADIGIEELGIKDHRFVDVFYV